MTNSGGDPAANTDNIAKEPEKAAHVGRIGSPHQPGEGKVTPSEANSGKTGPGSQDQKKA
ncbi:MULTISPECIES: hypothetical protein [Roseomonadaceae]|uniref:Uncharacterized protein n=1 Tax=Falsiroseomonas oleicola TaxID=2801474 RepID=A0ABS6HES1_9PROT|nr:hypothetical protein [Roseomonas oleicola]MBU8547246.1 hypothetical protein [Roseomonas oleicola]